MIDLWPHTHRSVSGLGEVALTFFFATIVCTAGMFHSGFLTYDDGHVMVPDCVHVGVEIYDKWYIESNDTYVFNTSAVYGWNDNRGIVTEQGVVKAHVIVSPSVFHYYNISDELDGWICADQRVAIEEYIGRDIITLTEGELPWWAE